jgi:hypothetical protein
LVFFVNAFLNGNPHIFDEWEHGMKMDGNRSGEAKGRGRREKGKNKSIKKLTIYFRMCFFALPPMHPFLATMHQRLFTQQQDRISLC